jgi:hypothetical protein
LTKPRKIETFLSGSYRARAFGFFVTQRSNARFAQ